MPIKGLTDRGLKFPQIGNIRKGGEKKNGIMGRDLKHFRVEFDELEVEASKEFVAKYGTEPQQIDILLPFVSLDDNWSAWMEAYTASRLIGRSDGEFIQYLIDVKTGEVLVKDGINQKTGQPEPHRDIAGMDLRNNPIKFKAVGRLKVVLPHLHRAAYLMVHTTSVLDIVTLTGQLKNVYNITGNCQGIPLVLKRRPQMVSVPKPDGSRSRMEKWLLHVEINSQPM